jgi:hypothetical protein
MNSKLVLLLCLVLFVVVTTVDGKVVKETKRKKKPKKKAKLNVNKFKNTMRKAANRQKEKKHQQCAKIVKAARKGDLDILKPGGAPPSDKQRRRMKLDCLDEVGYSPMHHAARKGQIEFLQVLIEMGANTEIENNQGKRERTVQGGGFGAVVAVERCCKCCGGGVVGWCGGLFLPTLIVFFSSSLSYCHDANANNHTQRDGHLFKKPVTGGNGKLSTCCSMRVQM